MAANLPRGPKNIVTNVLGAFTFTKLWERGWPEAIPIIPAGAQLHPISKISPKSIGKLPGRRVEGDLWVGYRDWLHAPFNESVAREWDTWGASIGHRTGKITVLDCDITEPALADSLYKKILSIAPDVLKGDRRRWGQWPKWAWVFRVAEPVSTWRIHFARPGSTILWNFDIMGRGRQFVMAGVHPKTGKPYQWATWPLHQRFDEFLQLARPAFLERVKHAVQEWIREQGLEVRAESRGLLGGDRKPPPQHELTGEPDMLISALEAIPNALSYDDWINLMFALHGAVHLLPQGEQDRVFEAFVGFCERFERGPPPTIEEIEYKWQSMKPPFILGADYVYGLAGTWGWNKAQADRALRELPEVQAAIAAADEQALAQELLAGLESAPAGEALRRTGVVSAPQVQLASERAGVFSDQAVALRFVEAYRDRLCFVGEVGYWYAWDGQRWARDATRALAAETVREFVLADANRLMNSQLNDDVKEKIGAVAGTEAKVRKVMALVKPAMTLSIEWFDQFPWHLNTPSGVVDLTSGQKVAHSQDRRMTRITGVGIAPSGVKPQRWLRFLEEVTQGDAELVGYLKRAIGYTLVGELTEQVFFFLYGPGGNGKSVLLNTLRAVLGSYATQAAHSAFIQTKFSEHTTIIASLAGYRMVQVPEVNTGDSWNERLLKSFSAGDHVKARFMRADEFEYRPEGTLWFAGNDRPALSKVDPSMERRFRLITFDYSPPRPDPHLEQRLVKDEGPAILRWAIEGCLEWQQHGLGAARAVEQATRSYFAEHDVVRAWIEERCELDPYAETDSSSLWNAFQQWQKTRVMTATDIVSNENAFFKRLARVQELTRLRSSTSRRYRGIRLRMTVIDGGKGDSAGGGAGK